MAHQACFAAIALLIEFVAPKIKEKAVSHCTLPVEITAVHVGPCATARREIISIDISEYGDPLHTRTIRMPFTNYRKPWMTGLARRLKLEDELPPIRAILRYAMDFRQAIKIRQEEVDMRDLAQRACVRIPLQEEGTRRLLKHYLAARLRRFHEFYYPAQLIRRNAGLRPTAGRLCIPLPHCVQHILEFPNDLLLKPAGMQLVTRCLLAQAGIHATSPA